MAINTALKITYLKTEDLLAYAKNSRTHSKEQVKQIVKSIKEFGFVNPILIDEKGEIIAGHGRLRAANRINMKNVPCIRLVGLTDAQKRAYCIADNRIPLNAGWDAELLASELSDLEELEFKMDVLGFDEDMHLSASAEDSAKLKKREKKKPTDEDDDTDGEDGGSSDGLKPHTIECPECGHEFTEDHGF